jgi:DNA-binding Lrp family transcriptional regulator
LRRKFDDANLRRYDALFFGWEGEPMQREIRISAADVQIIQCLQRDARTSVARIAKILRMPTSSVRHRLQKLVKSGFVKFEVTTNPLLLGYEVWVNVELQVDLSKLQTIARKLAHQPEVYLVYIMTGRYDILVGAVFRTNEDYRDFFFNKLLKIPGIKRALSSNVFEAVKRSMSFPLPNSHIAHARKPRRRARA